METSRTINLVQFRTPKDSDGFRKVMFAVFTNSVSFKPMAQSWTLRLTDDQQAEAVRKLQAVFEIFYPGDYPRLVRSVAHTAPAPTRPQPIDAGADNECWYAAHVIPAGDFYGPIAV